MNNIAKAALGPLLFASLAGCALLPKNEIVTEKTIAAEPAAVWSVLTDTASYGEWNPFIVAIEGEMVQGERFEATMEATPGEPRVFNPKLLNVAPDQELRWLGSAGIPGFFNGEHYFLLEPEDGSTRLIHGELFSGIGLWFIDTNSFETNLRQMNDALKDRVEALEDERAQATN